MTHPTLKAWHNKFLEPEEDDCCQDCGKPYNSTCDCWLEGEADHYA